MLINFSMFGETAVGAGVPQGSVLGPLLFLVHVNDISENLLSPTRFFANDRSHFFSASRIDDIEGIINYDLAIIHAWGSSWLVAFNPNKIEAILFTFKYAIRNLKLIFNDNCKIC